MHATEEISLLINDPPECAWFFDTYIFSLSAALSQNITFQILWRDCNSLKHQAEAVMYLSATIKAVGPGWPNL